MLRFVYVIAVSLPFIIFYICKGRYIERHSDAYTEEDRYHIARRVIGIMQRNGHIATKFFGKENLPRGTGYVMYANHQGKYDALGIMAGHEEPCTVVIDEKRSHLPIAKSFVDLVQGQKLDKANVKSQVQTMKQITREVEEGRHFIIFPEGGYCHNRNEVHDFLPGAFKCAIRSRSPIIPVALIDSYKPFELNSLRHVETQVHYLKPISYEEYKDMNTKEISQMVRARIQATIAKQLHEAKLLKTCLEDSERLLDRELASSCLLALRDMDKVHN